MARIEPNISHLDLLVSRSDETAAEAQEKSVYRIGDLAREFDVTLRTLRFYEDRGLITPERSGSTRLYSPHDRSRLRLILLAKRVGFSLVEIHELMEIYDLGTHSDKHLQIVLEKFRKQMDVLNSQKTEVENSIIVGG